MVVSVISNRRFGVEIECKPPGGTGYSDKGYAYVGQELKRNGVQVHSVGYDGSGCEVRTRVLQGESGMQELEAVFNCLNELGCGITNKDGQHIHLEGKEFQGPKGHTLRVKLVESYLANREHIAPFVDPSRHTNDMCANAWGGTLSEHVYDDHNEAKPPIERLKEGGWYGRKGYDLNLANLAPSRRGTIEIRLLEGNLDFAKARAWIELWQKFTDHVKNVAGPLRPYKTADTMFLMLGLDPVHRLKLKEIAATYEKGSK